MRRPVVLTLGVVVVLTLTGCFGAAAPVASAGRVFANTSWMCDALDEVLADAGTGFGGDLATMLVYQAHGDRTAADRYRAAARTALGELSFDLWVAAQAANDPALTAAVAQAEDNLARLAQDQSLLLGIRSFADFGSAIGPVTEALRPLTRVCG
jgi:hypothetical protein